VGYITPFFANFVVSCAAFPIKGKPPPIIVPSAAYLSLFLSVAAAFFLPFNPLVSSSSKNNASLPGSDAKKSVTPTTVKPSNDLTATVLNFFNLLFFF
jgi:hypothetical protein